MFVKLPWKMHFTANFNVTCIYNNVMLLFRVFISFWKMDSYTGEVGSKHCSIKFNQSLC